MTYSRCLTAFLMNYTHAADWPVGDDQGSEPLSVFAKPLYMSVNELVYDFSVV